MLSKLGTRRFQASLRNILFVCASGLVVAQAQANLIVNGSFEDRTSPTAPISGFSPGDPDNWVDRLGGGTYLVHEDNGTVPGDSAIDGDIIVGGNQNILLHQRFTTLGTGRLRVSWTAANEFINEEQGTNTAANLFHETAVQFFEDTPLGTTPDSADFIDWSDLRASANVGANIWFDHSFTTTAVFEPGDYLIEFFVGGRSAADNLIVTQVPVPTPATAALFGLGLAGISWKRRKKA